ncbi:MAG: phosphotransferase family protein [Planctomycetaceae bacterium]
MQPPFAPHEQVRSLLGTDLPIRLLLATDEFDTWAVGDDLVAKLPRNEAHAWKVASELALHDLLRERLGDLVPAIRRVGEPSEGFPFPFLVFDRARGLQGQDNDGATIEPGPGLVASAARFLAALHAISPEDAYAHEAGDREVWFETPALSVATVERVSAVAGDGLRRFLEAPPPAASARRALCHTDLKGEHVFVDETRRRLTAVIDWSDAEVCDPAKDLAGFAIWLGPAFVRDVAVELDEVDPTLAERAIWLGRRGLREYWEAVLAGRETAPIPLIERQAHIAFGG